MGIGGNKVRNLEYLLGHAIAEGKNTILVSGQTQSNLCSLCAASCRRLGLRCVIVHNSPRPELLEGNALLNHILGMAWCRFKKIMNGLTIVPLKNLHSQIRWRLENRKCQI